MFYLKLNIYFLNLQIAILHSKACAEVGLQCGDTGIGTGRVTDRDRGGAALAQLITSPPTEERQDEAD